jgi:hypothetical protein
MTPGDSMLSTLENVARNTAFVDATTPQLLLDESFRICAVNDAYLGATGQSRGVLLEAYMFDAFPDNPEVPDATGVRNLGVSLEQVMRTSRSQHMWIQRYDVPDRALGSGFVLKYWSPSNSPVRDDVSGRAVGVVHHVEDVTAIWAPALGHGQRGIDVGDLPATTDLGVVVRNVETVHQELATERTQLREALKSRIDIEQAVGIVMARAGCGPAEAFEVLRRTARDDRLPLLEVCRTLIRAVQRPQAGPDRM